MKKLILYYDHKSRTITDEDGNEISINHAKMILDEGLLADCNEAFARLCRNDFDMDAVEADYRELESV